MGRSCWGSNRGRTSPATSNRHDRAVPFRAALLLPEIEVSQPFAKVQIGSNFDSGRLSDLQELAAIALPIAPISFREKLLLHPFDREHPWLLCWPTPPNTSMKCATKSSRQNVH